MTDKQVQQQIDKLIKNKEVNIAKAYQKASNNVKSKMALLYEKYSIGGKLTYAEMSKYNRLNSMYKFLSDDLQENWGIVDKEFKSLVGDIYNESYYRHGFMISEDVGLNLNFGLIPKETINSLYSEPNVSGLSLRETLINTRYNLLLKERQTIIQGFLQGESYPKMAKRIQDEYNKSFKDSLRIARTEGTRAENEANVKNLDDAEDMGIEIDRIWLAAKDSRTRDSHQALDGQIADEEGFFHFKGAKSKGPGDWGIAEMDINCRCTIKAEVKEVNVKKSNIIDKPVDSYEQWKKAQK